MARSKEHKNMCEYFVPLVYLNVSFMVLLRKAAYKFYSKVDVDLSTVFLFFNGGCELVIRKLKMLKINKREKYEIGG